jgi:hypothetical protein
VAGALLLGGCASYTPSWDWVPSLGGSSSGPAVSLTIESDPPGADAKTSLGPSCRTPCMVPVSASQPFTVSYALNGYLPMTVEVIPRVPEPTRFDPEIGPSSSGPDLSPNPVFAQLQPAPPPPPVKRGRARPKQVAKQPQLRQ